MTEELREERFRLYCEYFSFDLPSFDRWLSELKECGAKKELQTRRKEAMDAFFDQPDNEDAFIRHLDWMMLRRRAISREEALLPSARRDSKRQAGTRKPRNADIDEWISVQLRKELSETIDEMFKQAPEDITDRIGLAAFKKRVARCRKRLK